MVGLIRFCLISDKFRYVWIVETQCSVVHSRRDHNSTTRLWKVTFFATESQKQVFRGVSQAMSKTVLFDLVFLTPRQKVSFGPRTQNDDFLGTRPRAAPLGSYQKNSSFFVLGTQLLCGVSFSIFCFGVCSADC